MTQCLCKSILPPPPHFNLTQLPILPLEELLKGVSINFNCLSEATRVNETKQQLSLFTMNIFLTNSIFIIITIAIFLVLFVILVCLVVRECFIKKPSMLCFKQSPQPIAYLKPDNTISFLDTNSCNLIVIPSSSSSSSGNTATNSLKTLSTSPLSNQTTLTSGGSSFITDTNYCTQPPHFYESIKDLNAEYYFDCEAIPNYTRQEFLSTTNQLFYTIRSHIV